MAVVRPGRRDVLSVLQHLRKAHLELSKKFPQVLGDKCVSTGSDHCEDTDNVTLCEEINATFM